MAAKALSGWRNGQEAGERIAPDPAASWPRNSEYEKSHDGAKENRRPAVRILAVADLRLPRMQQQLRPQSGSAQRAP